MKPTPLKENAASTKSALTVQQGVLMLALCGICAMTLDAAQPSWWNNSGAVNPAWQTNDFGVVNQGQLKQFTEQATAYLNANLANGAGATLNGLVAGWSSFYRTNGYSSSNPYPRDLIAANQGQVKYIASLIDSNLVAAGYLTSLPSWLVTNGVGVTNADDYNAATIGQLKEIFNFDLTPSNFVAQNVTNGTLTLTWTPPTSTNVTAIDLNELSANGEWTNVYTFTDPMADFSYTITRLTSGEDYTFQLVPEWNGDLSGSAIPVTVSSTYYATNAPLFLPNVTVAAPNPEPTGFPAGFDTYNPPVTNITVSSTAPAFAAWTLAANPDENIIATGKSFTTNTGAAAGMDTRFLTYGRSGTSGDVLLDGQIQRLDGSNVVAVLLNSNLPPNTMYMVWPKNANGWGTPVCVNQTMANWLGPDVGYAGQTNSVYGQNLNYGGFTSPQSSVYIKPSGNHQGWWATVTAANPYKVDYIVPSALTTSGNTYEVWVHNGHGEYYGWSGPLTLTVQPPLAWSGTPYNVTNAPYSAVGDGSNDDAPAIQAALTAASSNTNSPVYLPGKPSGGGPGGTYLLKEAINIPTGVCIYGDGTNSITGTELLTGSDTMSNVTDGYSFNNCTICMGNNLGEGGQNIKVHDLTISNHLHPNSDTLIYQKFTTNVVYANCNVFSDMYGNSIDNENSSYQYFNHCQFTQFQFFSGGTQMFFDHCAFFGVNDQSEAGALFWWGVNQSSVSDCRFYNYYNNGSTNSNDVLERAVDCNGTYGESRQDYFGNNQTPLGIGPSTNSVADNNAGEQYLFEGVGTDETGYASSENSTSVTINSSSLSQQPSLAIVAGTGLGQARHITGWSVSSGAGQTTITVSPPFSLIPDSSSEIAIGNYYNNIVLYNNTSSGFESQALATNAGFTSAHCGCSFYGGSFGNIVANNYFGNLYGGVTLTDNPGGGATTAPVYFNAVKGNAFQDVKLGMMLMPNYSPETQTNMIGNVIKDNSIAAVNIAIPSAISTNTIQSDQMVVFEHNTMTNVPSVFSTNSPLTSTAGSDFIFYENSANAGTNTSGSIGMTFPQGTGPALLRNTFTGYLTNFAGSPTNAILEVPLRNFSATSTNGSATVVMPIWNSGAGPMSWIARATPASWLSVSSGSGSIGPQGSTNLVATCTTNGLSVGSTTTGTIAVTDTTDGTEKITQVVFTVGN